MNRNKPRDISPLKDQSQTPSAHETEPKADALVDDERLFYMANLSPNCTGLPFVLWISSKSGATHDVRVWISQGPKYGPSEMISVAIRPEINVVGGGRIEDHDLDLLRSWIKINYDVIVGYWEGEIEYTERAIAALKSL